MLNFTPQEVIEKEPIFYMYRNWLSNIILIENVTCKKTCT